METILNHHDETRTVPIDAACEALRAMETDGHEEVMTLMLYLTGCRITELDKMDPRKIFGTFHYWPLGKRQQAHRKVELPVSYLEKLQRYRAKHKVCENRLFGISSETFQRYFNRFVRPQLSPRWQEKRPKFGNDGSMQYEYILQLKGFRKTYQTYLYYTKLQEHKDAYVALEITSKEMKHSSKQLTASHYIENMRHLGIKTVQGTPQEMLNAVSQTRLLDFTTR